MSVLKELQEIAATPDNRYLQEHRSAGGKIIGLFCSYVPEELILAAGMVPFRMRATGSSKTTLGDTWFSSFNCSYTRHLFDLALENRFSFLDGLIFINACDHLRRMYDNWQAALEHPSWLHFLAVPHKTSEGAADWYRQELAVCKASLEEHFQVTIAEQDLWDAIRLSNRLRRLLAELYALRQNDAPPLTGAEMLAVILAGTALPRRLFIAKLEALREEIAGRNAYGDPPAARLMIQSGCLEETAHLEQIEGQGAAIVDDSLCLGRRYFDTEVVEPDENASGTAPDPLDALTRRYLHHLSCPRMGDDFYNRLAYTRTAARDFRLDGLICERLKFCDLWGGEAFILKQAAKEMGLPVLYLERELYGGGAGQLKTRVQAFLERVGKY